MAKSVFLAAAAIAVILAVTFQEGKYEPKTLEKKRKRRTAVGSRNVFAPRLKFSHHLK